MLFLIGNLGGYLNSDEIELARCSEAPQVIDAYLASDHFGTSFLASAKVQPHEHGPFRRGDLAASDFQLLDGDGLSAAVAAMRDIEHFKPASDDQWAAIDRYVLDLRQQYSWFTGLRLSEKNKDRQHEGGFVFWVFREFLLANPQSNRARRLLFAFE